MLISLIGAYCDSQNNCSLKKKIMKRIIYQGFIALLILAGFSSCGSSWQPEPDYNCDTCSLAYLKLSLRYDSALRVIRQKDHKLDQLYHADSLAVMYYKKMDLPVMSIIQRPPLKN